MTNSGKRARRSREQVKAILDRLAVDDLDKAERILSRLEEYAEARKADPNLPLPTFDDIIGKRH